MKGFGKTESGMVLENTPGATTCDRNRRVHGFRHLCDKKYISKAVGKRPNGADDKYKKEFVHAVKLKGADKMVAVVMESSCNDQSIWKGAVNVVLGNHLYTSLHHGISQTWKATLLVAVFCPE